MNSSTSADRGGVQVIARAATILRALQHEPRGLSLGEIATRVGLPRSTVQRIVAALAEEKLVGAASEKSGVRLGPALLQLASAADSGTEKIAREFMERLSRQTDETVDLAVLDGDEVVFIDQIQGTQRLAAVSAVGKRFPLHCTANGKALLSILPPHRRAAVFAGRLQRYTSTTITDRAAIEAALDEGKTTGLFFDHEEHSEGICAVGTAFRDSLGREYSLSCPVPSSRFAAKRELLVKLLKKTKGDLLVALGVSAGT